MTVARKLLDLFRRKAAPSNASPVPYSQGGWLSLVREPFTGAWQRNVELSADTALTYSAVFRCVSLISSDIAKMRMRLVRLTSSGVWEETDNPAFSPVLRKPNRWQSRQQFYASWMESKLIHGNTFVLKERDGRGVVTRLLVLNPNRVTTLVAPDSSVYYDLRTDDLAGIQTPNVVVPESEVIHDRWNTFCHPLVGTSPISACALAAAQGLAISNAATKLFQNGGRPSGILTAPGFINEETALRLKHHWNENYGPGGAEVGKVAVLGDGLKFETVAMTSKDAELAEQMRLTAETVASVFGVPFYLIGGPLPTYNSVEALTVNYYSQCLQQHIEAIEALLDEGLGLGPVFGNSYGAEFDLSDLLRMDSKSRAESARQSIQSGMSPNEVRMRYFDLPPVPGGEVPYLQEQMWKLQQLGDPERPLPGTKPPAAPTAEPPAPDPDAEAEERRLRAIRNATQRFYQLADQEMMKNGQILN